MIRSWICRRAVPTLTILLWAWRVGAWVAGSAFSTDSAVISIAGATVLGLAADLAVALAIGRVLERLRLSCSTAILFSLALSVPLFSIRALDLIYCFLDMQHWQPHGFTYLSLANANLLLMSSGPWLVAFWALSVAAASWVWSCAGASLPHAILRRRADLVAFTPAAVLVGAALVWPTAGPSMPLIPEVNFLRAGWHWLFPDDDSQNPMALRPETRQDLVEFGLLPQGSPDPDYPMFSNDVYERPLDSEGLSPGTAPDEVAPNVVITVMESVNPDMIAGLGGPVAGITPNLDRLSKDLTRVNGFHGTASPTLAGLVAHLCSTFATLDGRMVNSRGLPIQTRLFCLPHLLRRHGYRTIYAQGGSKDFANKEGFLRAAGFEQVFTKKDLRLTYPDAHTSNWGFHDEQLVDFVIARIEEAEAKRKRDGRPYLLVMLMLDTHFPGLPSPSCKPDLPQVARFSANMQTYFRSLHCTDRALGTLSDHLLADGRRDSLLWAITSDHRAGSNPDMRRIYAGWGQRYHPRFGPLPLLIHEPFGRIPDHVDTLSGSQDLAPSIAHLLGLPLGPNGFVGRSMFGSRDSVPFIVGVASDNMMWVENTSGGRDVPLGRLHDLCLENEPVLDSGPQPASCDLESWFNLQRALWRQNHFVPARLAATMSADSFPRVIAHGLGAIDGARTTNSPDAFRANYDNGCRVFEVDLWVTGDSRLIAHRGAFHTRNRGLTESFTFDEFLASKYHDKYEAADADRLATLLKRHPESQLVTDIRGSVGDSEIQREGLGLLCDALAKQGMECRQRVIPQLHNVDGDLGLVKDLEFDRAILTLYRDKSLTDDVVVEAAKRETVIRAIAMPPGRATPGFLERLRREGLYTYVHTINGFDSIQKLMDAGAWGVYTDYDCRAPWRPPASLMERVAIRGHAWVEVAGRRTSCNPLGCPGQPGGVYVATRKQMLRGKSVSCLRMHPPQPSGSIGVAMPVSEELKLSKIRVSLADASARAGGGPVSVQFRGNGSTMAILELSDQEPTAEYRLGQDARVSGFSVVARAEDPKNRVLCVQLE